MRNLQLSVKEKECEREQTVWNYFYESDKKLCEF